MSDQISGDAGQSVSAPTLLCPQCGSNKVAINSYTDVTEKRRGCIAWGLWLLLACCTLGLAIIIPALTNTKKKSARVTEAVCQSCGHRWVLSSQKH
jgi:DNA-directed RNA polymerase subunit RPC12/RpoP